VLAILTRQNVGHRIRPGKAFSQMRYMGTSIAPLFSDRTWHDGQIVAVVVAESYETAREAAGCLAITYAAEQPSADSPGSDKVAVPDKSRACCVEVSYSASIRTSAALKADQPREERPKVGDTEGGSPDPPLLLPRRALRSETRAAVYRSALPP
jgi:CO/xanthine dehydrogenase Mo-binding subunit